jgi:hypothetical protein
VTLPDDDPAIFKLVMDSIYLRQHDTRSILDPPLYENNFLVVLKVYALAKRLRSNIAMHCVAGGLDDILTDMIFKLHVLSVSEPQ